MKVTPRTRVIILSSSRREKNEEGNGKKIGWSRPGMYFDPECDLDNDLDTLPGRGVVFAPLPTRVSCVRAFTRRRDGVECVQEYMQ